MKNIQILLLLASLLLITGCTPFDPMDEVATTPNPGLAMAYFNFIDIATEQFVAVDYFVFDYSGKLVSHGKVSTDESLEFMGNQYDGFILIAKEDNGVGIDYYSTVLEFSTGDTSTAIVEMEREAEPSDLKLYNYDAFENNINVSTLCTETLTEGSKMRLELTDYRKILKNPIVCVNFDYGEFRDLDLYGQSLTEIRVPHRLWSYIDCYSFDDSLGFGMNENAPMRYVDFYVVGRTEEYIESKISFVVADMDVYYDEQTHSTSYKVESEDNDNSDFAGEDSFYEIKVKKCSSQEQWETSQLEYW